MSWFGGKKKEKKKEFSGFPGDCSEQQIQVLQKFKKHVYDMQKLSTLRYDEIYLLRFLRARKFDIGKTTKMWDDYIYWRAKQNIDDCWVIDALIKNFKFPELPQLRKMYPHGYHKCDKQLRPIYIERVGFIDVDKVFKVMKTQNMLNYYALLYETLLTTIFEGCTKAKFQATGQNNKVCQTITILDLKNVKLGNVSKAYDFLKPVTAMAQDNYPQILGNMFIVNAPMLFTGIWTIVKMWIDDKTKQKIKILGSSYKKELLEFIDAENLPAFLDGGKCTCGGKQCRLEANVGPWNPEGKEMFEENINLLKDKPLKQEEPKAVSLVPVLESKPQLLAEETKPENITEVKQEEASEGTQAQEKKQEKDQEEEAKEVQTQRADQGTQTEDPDVKKQEASKNPFEQQKNETSAQDAVTQTTQNSPKESGQTAES